MVGRTDVEEMIRAGYAARKRGDVTSMMEVLAPDATFQIAGDTSLCPIAMTTKGLKAIRDEFSRLLDFEYGNQEMLSLAVDGNHAFIHWRTQVTYRPTGKSAILDIVDQATFNNGKVAAFVQFTDTAAVAELMR